MVLVINYFQISLQFDILQFFQSFHRHFYNAHFQFFNPKLTKKVAVLKIAFHCHFSVKSI